MTITLCDRTGSTAAVPVFQGCAKIVTGETQSGQFRSSAVDDSIPQPHRDVAAPGRYALSTALIARQFRGGDNEHVGTSSCSGAHMAMAPVRMPLRLRARELDGRVGGRSDRRGHPGGSQAEPAGCAVHPPSSWAPPASQFPIRERRSALIVSARPSDRRTDMQGSINKQVAKEAFVEALATFLSLPMDNFDWSAHRSALAKVREPAAPMLADESR